MKEYREELRELGWELERDREFFFILKFREEDFEGVEEIEEGRLGEEEGDWVALLRSSTTSQSLDI